MADQLAVTVREQWDEEARIRRLNDPYPLSVCWAPADPQLTEDWRRLRALGLDWSGGTSGELEGWAAEPSDLAGAGTEIADVLLRRTPTRRLVVLGGAGSGKTMLLVRLLLAVADQRAPGGAVPVLLPLASWNPSAQNLHAWLAERLAQDYVGLRAPAPAYVGSMNRARALLEHRLILPILDGLDELPPTARAVALDEISRALPPGQSVVVSSRVAEYQQAQSPAGGVPVKLAGAAGIELLPLTAGETAAYLTRDAGGEHTSSAARWERVLVRLGSDAPVARALRTPLMVFLARTVYNPRPGETATHLPDPAELCDEDRLPTQSAVERHLLDAFIPAAYRGRPGNACRWSAQRAEHALAFLARHLQHTLDGTPDLAWWQLHKAIHRRVHQSLLATVAASAVGLSTLDEGPGTGVGFALTAGVLGWHTGGKPRWLPAVAFRWSWAGFTLGLLWAVGFGVILALSVRAAPEFWLLTGLLLGPVTGACLGHGVVTLAGREARSPDLACTGGPATLARRDRRVFWRVTLEFAFGYGLVLAVVLPDLCNGAAVEAFRISVLVLIPVFGMCGAFAYASWGHYMLARCYLTLRHRLPRNLLAFLADAHQRGVLRQAGAVYQFRHIDLQHHLAQR
ncbi:NACHT domain-containing protein [Streptomyces lusitanus]|uniref:NACHT domain-containing protein n=1 Tax=Streptomyces lusitanus TaxID=68232 RepID=A0ABU3JV75_9ACTN|nr:NACHT domain-containing protein [Streptomyces lusitanus]